MIFQLYRRKFVHGEGYHGRSAIYEAIRILENEGYFAERVLGSPKLFDIVAWKGTRTLCLSIRSARFAKLPVYSEHIRNLSDSIKRQVVNDDVQFWIYRSPGWSRWKISEGGASPVFEWNDKHPSGEAASC